MRTINHTHCAHCHKRMHAPSVEKLDRQKLRHARNCAPLLRALGRSLAADQAAQPQADPVLKAATQLRERLGPFDDSATLIRELRDGEGPA